MDKKLRLTAAVIVTESKMSKAAKIQMLRFIKEQASDTQIKALLMDGEIVFLDEQAEQIVNQRFNNFSIREGIFRTAFGILLLTPPGWVMYRLIRATFSKDSRKCGALSVGNQRDMCLFRAKITRAEKTLALLSSKNVVCDKSKNPAKCKDKLRRKIADLKADIREYKARIEDLNPTVNINYRSR